jgi:hypothetical protein
MLFSLSIKPLGFVTSEAAAMTNLLGRWSVWSISQNLRDAATSGQIALDLPGGRWIHRRHECRCRGKPLRCPANEPIGR